MVRERVVRDKLAIDAVSDLLLDLRSEDMTAGLWDASDMQWWWASEDSERIVATIWADEDGRDIAYLMVFDGLADEGPISESEIEFDLGWLPSADATVREAILPLMIERMLALPASEKAPVTLAADERDADLCRRLKERGFRWESSEDLMVMLRGAMARGLAGSVVTLPSTFRFDDERTRQEGTPHHLAKRNGAQVAERLRQCSQYRLDLDLCIRDEDGTVAAYCLCWLDARNGVGVFEPVRTEDAYQRRGLGRALMAEGIRRLTEAGAQTIKVARKADAEAAAGLYRGAGFTDMFRERSYVRTRSMDG